MLTVRIPLSSYQGGKESLVIRLFLNFNRIICENCNFLQKMKIDASLRAKSRDRITLISSLLKSYCFTLFDLLYNS